MISLPKNFLIKTALYTGLTALAIAASPLLAHAGLTWNVTNQWSDYYEKQYSQFVEQIGSASCTTIAKCLTSSANPYYVSFKSDPVEVKKTLRIVSDCGKLPYILRSYFAWKNGLPFSYTTEVDAIPGGEPRDIRYSQLGNTVTKRAIVLDGVDGAREVMKIANSVYSAMYRIPPKQDVNASGVTFPDFYSPEITRNEIRPGTIAYDPNGHVAIIYKVETDGRVRMMDAHPDYSLTHIVYGEKFARSRPAAGAGFKNWRPITYKDGKAIGTTNSNIPTFSLEQYYGTNPVGTNWSAGIFISQGQSVDYYDFVRARLAVGELRYKPEEETSNMIAALCNDLNDRVTAVANSIKSGVQNHDHPTNLPENIYGTGGDWESYSSPSRDARLKVSFRELRTRIEQFIQLKKSNDPRVQYDGDIKSLETALLHQYNDSVSKCSISYTKSDGTALPLSYEEVRSKLYKLSFDPYDCIELRWGASGSELDSCKQSSIKFAWYKAEQRLRNQSERTYDIKMNFNLSQLESTLSGSGIDEGDDVDTRAFLANSLKSESK